MRQARGLTLLELLITLLVLSVAMGIALPPLQQTLSRSAVRCDTRELLRSLRLARQTAVATGMRTALCGIDDNNECSGQWGRLVAIFGDVNDNGRIDSGEQVIRLWQRSPAGVAMRWQGFGPGYVRFGASGTAAANGAFTLCPRDGDRRAARQVILNRSGRAYASHDQDGDGVVEYGADKEPAC